MDMAGSYRPIALLSPVAKLIEKLLLPSLKESLPVANHQHGFRSGRSTTTCLDSIYHLIATGLNQPKPAHRTVLVALDLSKAFDTVRHDRLLEIIVSSPLAPSIKRWLGVYLRNRQAITEFRGVHSKYRRIKMGVPQGGVLSPTLLTRIWHDFHNHRLALHYSRMLTTALCYLLALRRLIRLSTT